jgi:hypothetical protein
MDIDLKEFLNSSILPILTDRRRRRRALVVVCLLLLAVPVLIRTRVEEPDVVGIWMNYDEITLLPERCRPEDWQNVVIFELRKGGEVIADQEVGSHCKVVCDPSGASCDAVTVPDKWDVPNGTYEVWWQGIWRNTVDGRDVIVQPAALKQYEDERRFICLDGAAIVFSRYLTYAPVILK